MITQIECNEAVKKRYNDHAMSVRVCSYKKK